ncbi:MAG: hypothetical protein ABIO17_00880 [Pseudoxanthomonas sp.]
MHQLQNPPVLCFSTPVLNRGRNTSVRRGRKWQPVSEARLLLADGRVSAPVVLHTELRLFSTLTDADLRYEHDPACRTVAGLLAVLQHLYPGFRTDEEITLCHFSFNDD